MGPEAKFYQQIKRNFKQFSLIRLENSSLLGTPDLLVCNTSGHFCTIELKVTKSKKIRFSPHQIAFHKRHPKNTFIMVKALGPLPKKTSSVFLFRGSRITELAACGLTLDACYSGWDACRLALDAWTWTGSGLAWSLTLEAWRLELETLRPGSGRTSLGPRVELAWLIAWSDLLRLRNSL